MEYIVFLVVVVLFLVLLFVKEYFDYRKEEKRFIKRLQTEYGVLSEKEYKADRFNNISHYFRRHKNGFVIDDITWNDLNMDEVFKRMNETFSAAGEEYLYHILRTPSFDREELDKRERMIQYFLTHDKERVECQFLFHKLGYTGKYSIYDYLDYLDNLGKRNNAKHYIADILVFVSILCMFISFPVGLVMLIAVFAVNLLSYFKIKNEIDPYITSFSYLFRLLHIVEKLSHIKISVLEKEWELLRKSANGLNGFKRGSFLLMSPGRMNASGNPIEIILDYLRMIFHLDLIQFNKMLSEVRGHIEDIDTMITVIGYVETMIAIGAFRKANENYCVPEFTDKKELHAEDIFHPLLEKPVKNSISANRSVLITGSNASGKSTFLKTIAINAILAQTVHTCMASSYQTSMFRVCSSMSLRDDIQGGDSYYMVEIKALKRILDELKEEGIPVLCFVDEVLRGTNTVERIAASAQILESLNNANSLCFAATHDIELTYLLEKQFLNYHFKEEISGQDIFFGYKLLDGRAKTRNAIKLLEIMGYDKEIIKKSEEMAENFMRCGKWNNCLS